MIGIDDLLLAEQQQYQQANTHSIATIDDLSLSISIGNILQINLINITNRNENNSTNYLISDLELAELPYTIVFGLICACLCFLTITGNLLVLITFRRMRTVSICKILYRNIYISQMNG